MDIRKFLACLLVVSCSAMASGDALYWRGHELTEVDSLSALPQAIRHDLHVDAKGLSVIADKGQSFNATDYVVHDLPMRRFLAAAHDGDTWLVAVEHGGRGYNVQVGLYVAGALKSSCVLMARPKTLQEVLSLAQTKCSGFGVAKKSARRSH